MRAPSRWWNPPEAPGLGAQALRPLGALYALATAQRVSRAPSYRAGIPVICVGNLVAGGTGKTPVVTALVQRLGERGIAAHVVSRGYGGSVRAPVTVDPARHDAGEVGDEPLLLAAFAPVHVAPDRTEAARLAVAAGAQAIVMDDGHQNPDLAKDLSIVVADAARGFGNGLCIPAGPLREPVARGLSRADLVVSIGSPEAQDRFGDIWGAAIPCPRLQARLEPLQTGMDWAGLRCLAFAGIGDPAKFFATLRALGADLVREVALDDHQPLTPALMSRMEAEARASGLQLVATEKDAVRLPPAFRSQVLALPVRLSSDDWTPLDAALGRILPGFSARRG